MSRTVVIILVVLSASLLTDTHARAEACFPKCRAGFMCHQGQCISKCNPACGAGQTCTAEARCVGADETAPSPAPAPSTAAPAAQVGMLNLGRCMTNRQCPGASVCRAGQCLIAESALKDYQAHADKLVFDGAVTTGVGAVVTALGVALFLMAGAAESASFNDEPTDLDVGALYTAGTIGITVGPAVLLAGVITLGVGATKQSRGRTMRSHALAPSVGLAPGGARFSLSGRF